MGATTSKVDGPLETLDADQVRAVVAGFGTQFAGAADKMREAGIDGDYLAHASDDDLAVVFEECGLTKLQQSLLKQKLRKATAPAAPPPLPPRPISPPPEAPTPPASPKAKAPAPLRVRVTCPADGHAGKPITVQIPDGRKARASIPEGCAPGETFTILVPAAPPAPVHRVSVTCPPDKPPGSQLLVKVPSGQTIRATVPQRLGPGRSFTVVAPAAPVATQYAVLPPPSVSLSSSTSLDLSAPSAAASGTAGIAKKFAKEVAKDYAWDQAKGCGKEVLASIVSSDSMADATGFLLGM